MSCNDHSTIVFLAVLHISKPTVELSPMEHFEIFQALIKSQRVVDLFLTGYIRPYFQKGQRVVGFFQTADYKTNTIVSCILHWNMRSLLPQGKLLAYQMQIV